MPQAEATHAATMAAGDHEQEDVIAFLSDPASYSGVQRVDRLETHGANSRHQFFPDFPSPRLHVRRWNGLRAGWASRSRLRAG